jgi:hypothetical protein
VRQVVLFAAVVGLWSCGDHSQREGRYLLAIDRVIRDECGLAQKTELPGEIDLLVSGSVLRAHYSLRQIDRLGQRIGREDRC